MSTNPLKFNQAAVPEWHDPPPTGVTNAATHLDYLRQHLRQRGEAIFPTAQATLTEMNRCLDTIVYSGLVPERHIPKAVKEECGHLYSLPRPWRWWCLRSLLRSSSGNPQVFWPLFLEYWSDCESNLAHGWLRDALEYAFMHEAAHRYLDPEDKRFFRSLPDRVTIYRGVARPGRHIGISWTTDRQVAEWFAGRHTLGGGVPTLLSGHVYKRNIIAAIAGRGEREVIALPRHVRGRGETQLPIRDLNDLRPKHWAKLQ
jgi:hypothetical protein